MMRKTARNIGAEGEDIAGKYLEKRGWRLIARNYSAGGGEIDIIGFRFGTLAYFEVKTRSNDKFGRPADAVDRAKISRIKKAVFAFRAANMSGGKVPVFYPCGITLNRRVSRQTIDIIEVYLDRFGGTEKINHIKEAESL